MGKRGTKQLGAGFKTLLGFTELVRKYWIRTDIVNEFGRSLRRQGSHMIPGFKMIYRVSKTQAYH